VATDNGTAAVASSLTPIAGGLFMLNPAVPATNKAVAIQNTSGDYIAYKAPEGVAKVEAGVNGATYLYVFENNNIIAVDPQVTGGGALVTVGGGSGACAAANSCYLAEQISNLTYATGSTAPSFSSVTGIGVLVSGTKLIFADPGNNRIASIDVSTCGPQASGSNLGACTVTTVASGHPFIGLGLAQGGTNYVATDTTGQIYLINGSTVSSFGLTTGSVQDGALGVVAPPAATTTAAPYLVQGNANNFFSTTATFTPTVPYNILPFAATAPVFNVAPNAALKILADTSNGTIVATAPGSVKAPFGIVWLPAAQVPPASPALTPDSYIFADNGNVRTLIP
ncbi:MAG: hypothetical protein JOZ38_05690, partial [Candidatus Eremiobacteraeota bacterium]|nr:hypothetical protein [Candidatus Eremiobacteraeota bacterium]